MSGILNSVFTTFFKKNAAFLSTVFIGAFAFEMAFDTGTDYMWDAWNKGRQWKDIKQRYMTHEEEEDE